MIWVEHFLAVCFSGVRYPKHSFYSGLSNPNSPVSGRLLLEGHCLGKETTFIFPKIQLGSRSDDTGSRVLLP